MCTFRMKRARRSGKDEGFRRRVSFAVVHQSLTHCFIATRAGHDARCRFLNGPTCSREVTVATKTREKLALLCPTAIVYIPFISGTIQVSK